MVKVSEVNVTREIDVNRILFIVDAIKCRLSRDNSPYTNKKHFLPTLLSCEIYVFPAAGCTAQILE